MIPGIIAGGAVSGGAPPGGSDPYWLQVGASLPMTSSFADAVGNTWTENGGVAVSGGSGVFDGVNDYLRLASNIAWAFGYSDFTVEGYFKDNASAVNSCLFDTRSASTEGLSLYVESGTYTGISYGTNSGFLNGTATLFSSSVLQHWAVVRQGSTVRVYLDGVQLFTATDPRFLTAQSTFTIGDSYLSSQPSKGSQNHFRVTRGVCRYPNGTTFTPPTGPFPTTGGTSPGTGPGAHRYWRLLISANDGSGSYMGLTELVLRDRDLVVVSGFTTTSTGISASTVLNGGNAASMAFDTNLSSTGWLSNTSGSDQWIKLDTLGTTTIGVPVEIREFDIYGSWNVPTASPKDFKLQWSDDDSSWTDAKTVTGETGWTSAEMRSFVVF